ncbi:MAG TPA: DUF1707 domain-containing protein [Propionibacteriaceae bacterium]|nr:DUF1707 domain-containing protein [Propionibacteriaceae bacterium]
MTANSSEPSNVGPIAGGHLRASDADREQVAAVLSTAYAEGRLTREEHDERMTEVMSARTFDDLVPITSDLVALASPMVAATPGASTGYQVEPAAAAGQPDRMVAVFGGLTRRGRWRVRRNTQALALFGGMDLDLRDAVFESAVVEISGFWCFGGCDIKVPAGTDVQDQVMGVFGGSDVRDLGERQPGAPTLVIKGLALFGGVSVKGPKAAKRQQ